MVGYSFSEAKGTAWSPALPAPRTGLLELSEPIKSQGCLYCSQAAINVRCLLEAWYKMQDLSLCKQFIQLLVSQYEPFSCEIIIFAALSILIPINFSSVPVIYLLLFWLHTYLPLTNDCMERFCMNGCGGLL